MKTFETVNYQYSKAARKWVFSPMNAPEQQWLFKCHGAEEAAKVARILSGAFKRTKGITIDNLARANINQVTA